MLINRELLLGHLRGVGRDSEAGCNAQLPVLSNATWSISASRSITTADLTRTPCRLALAVNSPGEYIVARQLVDGYRLNRPGDDRGRCDSKGRASARGA